MNSRSDYPLRLLMMEGATALLASVFISPFYFLLVNSVKNLREVLLNAASWPQTFYFSNYIEAWKILNFPRALTNSFLITSFSVIALAVVSSMTAYRLVRRPTPFNKFIFTVLISAMIIPFQSVMLQLVIVTSHLHLRGTLYGIVICYLGFGIPLSMFLYHGFMKTVPLEMEEAAVVDGCSVYGVFWRIVFPLLNPITVTVIILNSLWIWNDYLLPRLVIGGNNTMETIPLAIQNFFGQYMRKWDLAMAGLTLGVTPIVLFFLVMQKRIVEGITTGSIKG